MITRQIIVNKIYNYLLVLKRCIQWTIITFNLCHIWAKFTVKILGFHVTATFQMSSFWIQRNFFSTLFACPFLMCFLVVTQFLNSKNLKHMKSLHMLNKRNSKLTFLPQTSHSKILSSQVEDIFIECWIEIRMKN